MSFTLFSAQSSTCVGIYQHLEIGDEDVEFSIQFLSNPSQWIPLSLNIVDRDPSLTHYYRRGYPVLEARRFFVNEGIPSENNIQICNFSLSDSFRLRWLLTSTFFVANNYYQDLWSLDDVEVSLVSDKQDLLLTERYI